MCEPVTTAAIAATLIGTKMKSDQADTARSEQGALTRQEIARQRALENLARAKQGTALSQFGKQNVESQMRTDSDRLANLYNESAGSNIVRNPAPRSSAPSVIQGIEDQAMAASRSQVRDRGQRMGDLDAFGASLAALAPALQAATNQGRMSGNFARNSANVLNRELRAAQQGAYSPIGDLLQTLGTVGLNYGLKADDPEVIS